VVIPTVDRYPYLRVILKQLATQTIPPWEVLVVDQTPLERRESGLEKEVPELPLRVMWRDQAGQCSSRNAAIEAAGGDFLLFVDDDDEVPPDLIETHVANLERFGAEVSCGVAEEVGAGPLPQAFTYVRTSDVFPTNNSMVRRSALRRSGLFDFAYERGARADGDLGLRLSRSGALMVLDPAISVLHHHAPRGGLRSHQARVVTYGSSRRKLFDRHLPSATEIYLARRHFTPRQVREMLWLRAFGTLSAHGGLARRMAKMAVGLASLPLSGWTMARQYRRATEMLRRFPQIPGLE
jgi:glycosyltransferase involved in cell wall biosynthesis